MPSNDTIDTIGNLDEHITENLESSTETQESENTSNDNSFTFTLDSFSGPLDLLLFLVQQHKIDIYDVPITEITNQFLSYLNELIDLDLGDLTDFYKTATWLLLIKSRMLLPVHSDIDEEEIDTTRAELINTLIEYQRYKKLSEQLSERYEKFNWVSLRQESNVLPFDMPKESMWKEVKTFELFSIFLKLMDTPKEFQRVIDLQEQVTINEKMALIYEILETNNECTFDEIVAGGGVLAVVCSFLALLELMKSQQVIALQHAWNREIKIVRKS